MSSGDFIDLRLNREKVDHNESFWPSFTDIMTVVVMIFLMAMVVLLLRNMELVAELQRTVEAERAAAELARANIAEKENLSAELADTRALLASIQARLAAAEADNLSKAEALARTTGERDRLASANDALNSQLATTRSTLTAAETTLANRSECLHGRRPCRTFISHAPRVCGTAKPAESVPLTTVSFPRPDL